MLSFFLLHTFTVLLLLSSSRAFQAESFSFWWAILKLILAKMMRIQLCIILITTKLLLYGWLQKYSRLRRLLFLNSLVICFYLCWSGSTLPIWTNIIKVGSKSQLLTCSSNITLSLTSCIGSDWQRELNFITAILVCCIFGWLSGKHWLLGCLQSR